MWPWWAPSTLPHEIFHVARESFSNSCTREVCSRDWIVCGKFRCLDIPWISCQIKRQSTGIEHLMQSNSSLASLLNAWSTVLTTSSSSVHLDHLHFHRPHLTLKILARHRSLQSHFRLLHLLCHISCFVRFNRCTYLYSLSFYSHEMHLDSWIWSIEWFKAILYFHFQFSPPFQFFPV